MFLQRVSDIYQTCIHWKTGYAPIWVKWSQLSKDLGKPLSVESNLTTKYVDKLHSKYVHYQSEDKIVFTFSHI